MGVWSVRLFGYLAEEGSLNLRLRKMETFYTLLIAVAVVPSQPVVPTEVYYSPCATMFCVEGTTCREFVSASGQVEGRCLANPGVADREDVCKSGRRLLVDNGSRGTSDAFCGRGPNRIECPPNYLCDVAPDDSHALCCPTTVKPGECPTPPEVVGICGNMCRYDDQCPGETKCCPNACGATVCLATPPTCQTKKCGTNQRCVMHQVHCVRAPCDPVLHCVDIEVTTVKSNPCPEPPQDSVGICVSTCTDDTDCKNDSYRCCPNACGGAVCTVLPRPLSCETTKCGVLQRCEMQEVQCVMSPCERVPTCVDIQVKDGRCPADLTRGDTSGVCANECQEDEDCDGNFKCCSNSCGGAVCAEVMSISGGSRAADSGLAIGLIITSRLVSSVLGLSGTD